MACMIREQKIEGDINRKEWHAITSVGAMLFSARMFEVQSHLSFMYGQKSIFMCC